MSEQTQGAGRIRLDTAGRIVVGTDGSERARKAVDWGAIGRWRAGSRC
jgi:nucleotide-binding universal stress UspA family protein